jgi:hypothetical protein
MLVAEAARWLKFDSDGPGPLVVGLPARDVRICR